MKSHDKQNSLGRSSGQCTTDDGPLKFKPDGGWKSLPIKNLMPPKAPSSCPNVLCTTQADSSVEITAIPQSGTFTMGGFWPQNEALFSTTNPDSREISQVFAAQLDGSSVNSTNPPLKLDLTQNLFFFNIVLSGSNQHAFTFTNVGNTQNICIVFARVSNSDSGSVPTNSPIPTNSPMSNIPSSTASDPIPVPSTSTAPKALDQNSTSPAEIAIAVIIPILVVICLLLFTFYLRRRWRQQKVSVPLPSEGLKLDEPDRLETGSSYKAWSPSQSPFLPEHPIPRRERRPAPPRRGQRHFASFTLSSVSSIPEPPPSVNPPSTVSSRSSVIGIAQATFELLKPVRKDPPDTRRGVLRAVNVGDE